MSVLTSDHYIGDESRFRDCLGAAQDVACDGYLVTLGILPTFPATGYGYIQRGEFLGTYRDLPVYRAVRFKEKPDEKQARAMLQAGDHAWNSGMFIWRVGQILEEIARQMPQLAGVLDRSRGLGYPAAAGPVTPLAGH
jgi:mannose-1-phosphate guanylyltransferase